MRSGWKHQFKKERGDKGPKISTDERLSALFRSVSVDWRDIKTNFARAYFSLYIAKVYLRSLTVSTISGTFHAYRLSPGAIRIEIPRMTTRATKMLESQMRVILRMRTLACIRITYVEHNQMALEVCHAFD